MSAYALPGLFPPINSTQAFESTSTGEEVGSASKEEGTNAGPLHQTNEGTGSRISTLLKASVDLLSPAALANASLAEDTTEAEAPGIAVKEAKIDPVRLVQCLTGSSRAQQQPSQRKSLRRRGSRERLESGSPQSSPASGGATVQDENTKGSASVGSHHNEAIKFELSISFNGRKYTATRTLQCIFQLRDDLIREMNTRRRWLQISRATTPVPFRTPPESPSEVATKSEGVSEDEATIQIPEIPPMTGDTRSGGPGSGFVGRGFSMVHAMATSYVPVMERWLRKVLTIVPQDSECLSNFLWEPLTGEAPLAVTESCTSLSKLGSIKELDYDTEADDSDDDASW